MRTNGVRQTAMPVRMRRRLCWVEETGVHTFITSAKETRGGTRNNERGTGDSTNIGSLDAMREFLVSWDLDEFAVKNAERACVLTDLTPEQTVCIATLYLFLLARDRVRHSRFTDGRCDALDDLVHHYVGDAYNILTITQRHVVSAAPR